MRKFYYFGSYNSAEGLPKYFKPFSVSIDTVKLGFIFLNESIDRIIELNPLKEKEIKALIVIYNRWFKVFPFELVAFSTMKSDFENKLPFKYVKDQNSVSIFTPFEMIDLLMNISNLFFEQINASTLLGGNLIRDIDEHKVNLILEKRRLKSNLGYPNNQNEFSNIVSLWLEDEQEAWKELTPFLKPISQVKPDESEKLSDLINHINSVKIADEVKLKYKGIKGKRLKILLLALQELQLIPEERLAKRFHTCCANEFERTVASYTAMNDYKYNEITDKDELTKMKEFISNILNDNETT